MRGVAILDMSTPVVTPRGPRRGGREMERERWREGGNGGKRGVESAISCVRGIEMEVETINYAKIEIQCDEIHVM
jgi:hypothetical protein